MWQALGPSAGSVAVISGATGTEPATTSERDWLASLPDVAARATGTYLGHGFEPQFAMNIALATLALGHQKLFPPADASGVERAMTGPLDQVVVTGVGHWRGEGMALVEAAR
jgi:3-oxoacyl-[acyl-carrier-protein] synthase II